MIFCVQFIFTGCKISFDKGNYLTYFGKVTFQGEGLEGVKIVDNVNHYATTDENGEFTFTSQKKELEIFAVKQGYNLPQKLLLQTLKLPLILLQKRQFCFLEN